MHVLKYNLHWECSCIWYKKRLWQTFEVISVLQITYRISSDQLLTCMHDRASINGAAMKVIVISTIPLKWQACTNKKAIIVIVIGNVVPTITAAYNLSIYRIALNFGGAKLWRLSLIKNFEVLNFGEMNTSESSCIIWRILEG